MAAAAFAGLTGAALAAGVDAIVAAGFDGAATDAGIPGALAVTGTLSFGAVFPTSAAA